MKIRHPVAIKTVGLGAAWTIRMWLGTLRFRYHFLRPGPNVDPYQPDLPKRYIYAIWHENILLPVSQYNRAHVGVLISQHADGELLAEVCRHLRVPMVRGSTTRGGIEALKRLLRPGHWAHLAITPDGPRGPRRRVQPGLVYLAARTGMAIVPTGFGYERPWRLRSWDRFALPRPWTLGTCVTAPPIEVPGDADREQLESYRRLVEVQLAEVSELAESWAANGKLTLARQAG
jgi:lysophospholipid acyltransferase (LPLAT)-like uncharacterized protein